MKKPLNTTTERDEWAEEHWRDFCKRKKAEGLARAKEQYDKSQEYDPTEPHMPKFWHPCDRCGEIIPAGITHCFVCKIYVEPVRNKPEPKQRNADDPNNMAQKYLHNATEDDL